MAPVEKEGVAVGCCAWAGRLRQKGGWKTGHSFLSPELHVVWRFIFLSCLQIRSTVVLVITGFVKLQLRSALLGLARLGRSSPRSRSSFQFPVN